MKLTKLFLSVGLLLVLTTAIAVAQDDEAVEKYSLWFGGHYTDFEDYAKKVGEYRLNDDKTYPELKFDYLSRQSNTIFLMNAHYFDEENINGKASATVGDIFSARFQYRSLTKQKGQDMLANFNAREFLGWIPDPANPGDSIQKQGGKVLTHELLDSDPDYNTNRHEILSQISMLLSRQNNVRLVAAHRSVIENGTEQKIASNHCFSCHLTSKTAEVDKQTHQIEAGLEAELGKYDVGYTFGYRLYKSDAPDPGAYYDPAKHPVNGGSGAEFSSRVNYDDSTLNYATEPHTEKTSHKVKFKGDVGKGYLATSFGYSHAKNKNVDLSSDAISGAVNYAIPLSNRTRLRARASGTRLTADDVFIDVPTWREGRPGPTTDFDYTRYSSLNRTEAKVSAEVIHRLNPKMTLSVLGGFTSTSRDDYPVYDDGTSTSKLTGQVKLYYRKGLTYSNTIKYKFEKTSDPYTSGRGLLEYAGRDSLRQITLPSDSTVFQFIFYHEREGIRYQDITTAPTDYHEFSYRNNWRPSDKLTASTSLKIVYDKNGDLDSLDVEHFKAQPNLALTYMPNPKFSVTAGYTYDYAKSRGPVTVALFDG